MAVLFVDVSHHDWDRRGGNLDWAKVRASTSPVMIARATYGDPKGFSPITRHFGDFQRGATAAGFTVRGGYHNLIRGDAASIARQVDWLRRELDGHSCHWAMADIEPYAELKANGLWPRWSDVQRFHDRWYQVEQRVCAWYLPRWFWTASKDTTSLGQPDLRGLKGPLVQSHYAGGDGTAAQIYQKAGGDGGTGWDDFYGGRYPDIWQYTSDANVDGASSKTDANAFRGSFTQLAALLGTQGDDMSWTQPIVDKGVEAQAQHWLTGANIKAHEAADNTQLIRAELTALRTVVEHLVEALRTGGNDLNTAAILARVDAVGADAQHRHQVEMAALGRQRDAEVAALRAQLEALGATPQA